MAISSAVQSGSVAYVSDEKGMRIATIPLSGGTLVGFTGSTVSVRQGSSIYIYNEKGMLISTTTA